MNLFFLQKKYIQTHWENYLIIFFGLLLFFLPFATSGYRLGGDDARLYYLYPKEYFANYLFSTMTQNGLGGNMGYMAVSYTAPLIGIMLGIQTIFPLLNLQQVMYGLNLSLGFVFAVLFFRLFPREEKKNHVLFAILGGLLYITSPYLVASLYQFELITIYLVFFVPLFFYLISRGLFEKNMTYIVGASVATAILSTSLFALPWFIPVLIVFTPYFFYSMRQSGWFFAKALGVFVITSIGLHAYWLVHGIVSLVASRFDTNLFSLISSKAFVKEAEDTIYASTFLNGPVHQIAGYLRTSWTDRQPMNGIHMLGAGSVVLVALAGIRSIKVSRTLRMIFIIVVISLVIGFLFITPNMGTWNTDLFLFLNRTVPMFSMFRNTNSKFGLSLAFVSAFALYISSVILCLEKKQIWNIGVGGIGIMLLLYQTPGFLHVQGIGVTKPSFTAFSQDYEDLVAYIKTMPTTKRFVWYPMTFPGYTPISDRYDKESWYLGLSPLTILTGKSDIAGFYGVQTPIDPYRNWDILELLKKKQYPDVVRLLAANNVGYVITNVVPFSPSVQAMMDLFSFVDLQPQEYKEALLGEKIHDVGSSYSIYAIHPDYQYDTAFLTNDISDIATPKETVTLRQKGMNVYEVDLPEYTDKTTLVLLTPYHLLWDAKTAEGETLLHHQVSYRYGNAWDIPASSSGAQTVRITFLPDAYTMPACILSIGSLLGCIIYLVYPKKRV